MYVLSDDSTLNSFNFFKNNIRFLFLSVVFPINLVFSFDRKVNLISHIKMKLFFYFLWFFPFLFPFISTVIQIHNKKTYSVPTTRLLSMVGDFVLVELVT